MHTLRNNSCSFSRDLVYGTRWTNPLSADLFPSLMMLRSYGPQRFWATNSTSPCDHQNQLDNPSLMYCVTWLFKLFSLSYSLLSWNIFYFFDRKKKKKLKVEVRQCTFKEMLPNWQLYSQDLNKLPFCPKIPICIIIDFYLSMPAYGSFCWIGNKTVFVYVYVLETVAMDLQRVFYLICIKFYGNYATSWNQN